MIEVYKILTSMILILSSVLKNSKIVELEVIT